MSDGGATDDDHRFMRAALAFGRRGLGRTAPNPSVGAILVKDGAVIGRGVTAPGGRPHAETQALAAAGQAARGATLYVTLEPCSHFGHTEPCANAILAAGVARVLVAAGDPDPRVAGRGIARLREGGIAVVENLCAEEARRDHRGHIRRVTQGRPMVTLKLAETRDGFAATLPGEPRLLITGQPASDWVHMARALHDAVLVGAGTARQDDPLLTVRLPGMPDRQPIRIVLDTEARLSPASRLVASAEAGPVLILTGPAAAPSRVEALTRAGAHVVPIVGPPDAPVDLSAAMTELGGRGLTRLFCEGGPHLGRAMLEADLVDEFVLLTGPEPLGRPGVPAIGAQARAALGSGRFRLVEERLLGRDRLRAYERADGCSQG